MKINKLRNIKRSLTPRDDSYGVHVEMASYVINDSDNIVRSKASWVDPYTPCTNNRAKAGNDVIDILTSEDMENTPLGSQM